MVKWLACGLVLGVAVGSASLAQDVTWQEANRRSAAFVEEGDLEKAAAFAVQAVTLYPRQSQAYQPRNHAQLLLNAVDATQRATGHKQARQVLLEGIKSIEGKAGDDSEVLIALWQEAGRLSLRQDAINTGDGYFKIAYGKAEKLFGENDPRAILAMIKWTNALRFWHGGEWAQMKLNTARRRALSLGEDNLVLLHIDLLLAKLKLERGLEKSAIKAYQDLIERLEQRPDRDLDLLQTSYGQLAHAYGEVGDEAALDAVVTRLATLFPQEDGDILPLIRAQPRYPFVARASGGEACVVVEFTIDEKGRVVDPKILENNGAAAFADAALEALKKWRYKPFVADGKPVAKPGVQTRFNFEITDS
ncbi:MAG: energy transducer TonB [Pseudomonadota bacterium]